MTKDKIVLVLLLGIAVAAFCGGFVLIEKYEKDGLFQGPSTYRYFNKRFFDLLQQYENRKYQTGSEPIEDQVVHATLLHNVGMTSSYLENWPAALDYLNRSFERKIKCKSVTATSVIDDIESLGKIYLVIGKFNCARTAFDFAGRDWVREKNEESRSYARCLCLTGSTNLSMDNVKAAEFCFEKARVIFKKEEDRSSLARVNLLLAACDLHRDDFPKAQGHLDEAIKNFKIDFGDNYRSYFNDDIALLKCLEGRIAVKSARDGDMASIDRGIDLIREAIKEAELSFGENNVYTQSFRLDLAESLTKKKDSNAAISTLEEIEKSFAAIGLPHHPSLKDVYELHLKLLAEKGEVDAGLISSIKEKLSQVDDFNSKSSLQEASVLGKRINPPGRFLAGRVSTETWVFPVTIQIVLWAFSGMFACAIACAALAGRKDYASSVWFMLGVIFSFAAYLIISALPSRNTLSKEFGVDHAIINDARNGVFLLSLAPLLSVLGGSIFYYPAPIRDIFVVIFLTAVICAIFYPPIWCFVIARSKGRNPFLWTLIGLITSVFGLAALLLLPSTPESLVDEQETKNTHAEITMLWSSVIHMTLFVSVLVSIVMLWHLHVDL